MRGEGWLLNPILLKEVRGTLRTRRFFWSFTGTLFVLGAIFLLACATQAVTMQEDPEETGRTLFRICLWTLAGAMLLVLPAFSCTALASERELKSFDLLVTTRMTPLRIVFGKLAAAMVYAGLFLAAALPLIQISFLFGGVSPLEVLAAFAGLLALAATVTSVSLGISAPFRGTRWPTALAYSAALLVFGPLAAFHLHALEYDRPAEAGFWLLEVPVLAAAFLSSLSLVLAVRSTQHPSDNRATPLRLYALVLAAATAAVWLAQLGRRSPDGTLLFCLLFSTPWILAFACEAPVRSARSRKAEGRRWGRWPFARLLLPGSGPGALFAFLVGAGLMAALLAGAVRTGACRPRAAAEGMAVGGSLILFACAAGSLLATRLRPGTARAVLFAWAGLASAIPVCAVFLREARSTARALPPPEWALPWSSPSLAFLSWTERIGNPSSVVPQWAWWGGQPLHLWSAAFFASAGLLATAWGIRRRRNLEPAEASKTA